MVRKTGCEINSRQFKKRKRDEAELIRRLSLFKQVGLPCARRWVSTGRARVRDFFKCQEENNTNVNALMRCYVDGGRPFRNLIIGMEHL